MRSGWVSVAVLLWAAAATAQQAPSPDEFVPWPGTQAQPAAAPAPPAEAPVASRLADPGEELEPAASPVAEPDTDWAPLPVAPPVVKDTRRAPLPVPPQPLRAAPALVKRPTARDFNRVSLYGGLPLGRFRPAAGFYLGFPLVGVRVGFGLLDSLDVGLGFDSFYGGMNEPRGFAKLRVAGDSNWNLAALAEAGAAFFAQDPQSDTRGARWLTGRRNFNLEAGLVGSYQGDSVQAARLFFDGRYHLAADTQPFSRDPLSGVPPDVVYGHNLDLRMGAEMPFSPSTSFLFIFGFDLHGRDLDSAFMPVVSVGLVTGL